MRARARPMRWPLAAGELVRISVHVGGVQPDLVQSLLHPLDAFGLVADPCTVSPSRRWAPTVMRGLSELYGSWKMIWRSRRCRRISAGDRRAGWPVIEHLAGGRLDQAQQRAPAVVFPASAFADEAQGLAGGQRERDVVDRAHLGDDAGEDPFLTGKYFFRFRTSISGAMSRDHVAGHQLARTQLPELGFDGLAALDRLGAAGMELAARREAQRIGTVPVMTLRRSPSSSSARVASGRDASVYGDRPQSAALPDGLQVPSPLPPGDRALQDRRTPIRSCVRATGWLRRGHVTWRR